MAGATVAEPKSSAKKGKKQKKSKKRIPVRIDMTPMVDVVMLLITFFMLTTVFNTPQTMEINLPPNNMDTSVRVGESRSVDFADYYRWNHYVEFRISSHR